MHNSKAVELLLNKGSKTVVNGMTAFQYAIKKMDPECVRIICAFQNSDVEKTDFYETQELVEASKLEDPSVELLLTSKKSFKTAIGFDFIIELNKQIDEEVEEVINMINEFENKHNLTNVIISINRIERRLFRFDEIIRRKISDYNTDITTFRLQPKTNDNTENDGTIKNIISLWSDKLLETDNLLAKLRQNLFTPEGINISEKWLKEIKERKKFFENLFDRGIDEINSIRAVEGQKRQYIQDYKILKSLKEQETKCANELHPIVSEFLKKIELLRDDFSEDIKIKYESLLAQYEETINQLQRKPLKPKSSHHRTNTNKNSQQFDSIITQESSSSKHHHKSKKITSG